MLEKTTKIVFEGKCVVEGVEIASSRTTINLDDPTDIPEFYHRRIDDEACKANRAVLRADQAAFEDSVYEFQENVLANL